MAGDQIYWSGIAATTVPLTQVHPCNCIGPQRGEPVCPCMMPAYREREAGKQALRRMSELLAHGKPRVRVKAGRREVA